MNRLRRFIINGTLMAVVAILIRSVAVAFNVYISNKIGAVAMGLFSLISTVYGFGITFATSGINLANKICDIAISMVQQQGLSRKLSVIHQRLTKKV